MIFLRLFRATGYLIWNDPKSWSCFLVCRLVLYSNPFAMDENLKGTSTSVISQDSRDVEASESAVLTVQRVRRSIQLLKRAFFSNNNLSDGTDPVSTASSGIAAQTKKSSRLAIFYVCMYVCKWQLYKIV